MFTYFLSQEPFLMDRCVVTTDQQYEKVFEIHEQGKDTYLFKVMNKSINVYFINHCYTCFNVNITYYQVWTNITKQNK